MSIKKTSCVSHWCWRWSWRWCGNLCHPGLYIILEGSDVTFFLYNDAERHSQGNIPSALCHQDFGQISLLLHLKAFTQTHKRKCWARWTSPIMLSFRTQSRIYQMLNSTGTLSRMSDSVWAYRWLPCQSLSQPADLLHSASPRPSSPSAALFPSSWWERGQEVWSVTNTQTHTHKCEGEKTSRGGGDLYSFQSERVEQETSHQHCWGSRIIDRTTLKDLNGTTATSLVQVC